MVYLYLLLACFSWAALDFVRKVVLPRVSYSGIVILMAIGQSAVFLVWCMSTSGSFQVDEEYLSRGSLSVAINLIVPLIFLMGLKSGFYSQTVPFLAFVPVVSLLLARFIGERASLQQSVGIFLVFVGGLFLSQGKAGSNRNFFMRRVEALTLNRGALYMLAAAALWGSLVVIDKAVLGIAPMQFHGLCISVCMLFCYLWYHSINSRESFRAEFQTLPWQAFLIPFLAGSALSFTFLTIQDFHVAFYEATNRTISVLLSLVLGSVVFQEKVQAQQIFAVFTMCAGVFLILVPLF